jgi:hypothetical protein
MVWHNWDGDLQYDYNDEEEISKLLVGRRVEKVSENTLLLDDGTLLEVQGNEGGCSCGGGDYDLTELNNVDNAIMSVSIEERYKTTEEQEESDWSGDSQVYTIFVYAENEKIKLAEFEGDDGSGYYGTGFQITVKKSVLG